MKKIIIFAAGSGGNPERHLSFLESLKNSGCSVIAPHFERLMSPHPTAEDLLARVSIIKTELDANFKPGSAVIGIGHSIGGTLLTALAGGKMWMNEKVCLPIPKDDRITKLVLFAPPTGYFQAPNALEDVHIPIQAWVGSEDAITPPIQLEFLRKALSSLVQLRLIESAGHFSFMSTLPPQMTDSLPHREEFLKNLTKDVWRFVNEP